MIVRIFTEGQYRLDDELVPRLNELDSRLEEAVSTNNETEFKDRLIFIRDFVVNNGVLVADDELVESDAIVPDPLSTIEEVKSLMKEDGLIPG